MDIGELKLKEVDTLFRLIDAKSVRELARQMGVRPSQVTKQIQSLEHKVGMSLLDRSTKGIREKPEAKGMLKQLKEIQRCQLALSGNVIARKPEDFMSVATSSFFSMHLMPPVINAFVSKKADYRFRVIDLAPSLFLPVGLRSGFNYCIHLGKLDWPRTWESTYIGELSWILCARFNHKLAKTSSEKKVLQYPFVYPSYWADDGVRFGNDTCPVAISKRIKGHETSTATGAVEVIKQSEQVGFVPKIVAREDLKRKRVKAIRVQSWPEVTKPVYLTVKTEMVTQKQRDLFVQIAKKALVV